MKGKGKSSGGSNKSNNSGNKKTGLGSRGRGRGGGNSGVSSGRGGRNPGGWNPIVVFLATIFAVAAIAGLIWFLKPIGSVYAANCPIRDKKTITVYALAPRAASPVKLSIEQKDKDDKDVMPVKVIEELGIAIGEGLKASANMAAVTTSLILGEDLTSCKFTVEPLIEKNDEGLQKVDGPSAGALLTVGFISMIKNQDISNQATMTGTINPDGTVGFVGGIPDKLRSADRLREENTKNKGTDNEKKWGSEGSVEVIIPLQNDDKVSKVNDKLTKLKVKSVKDVYQAYKILTNNELPVYSSQKIGQGDLALSDQANQQLEQQIKKLESYTPVNISDLENINIDRSALESIKNLLSTRDAYRSRYTTYRGNKEGLSSAYNRISLANTINFLAEVMRKLFVEGSASRFSSPDVIKERINQFAMRDVIVPSEEKLLASQRNLKEANKSSISAMIDGYTNNASAETILKYTKYTSEQIDSNTLTSWLLGKIFLPAMVGIYTNNSEMSINLGKTETSVDSEISSSKKSRMIGLAKILQRAASANLDYFDTLIPKDIQNSSDMSYLLAAAAKKSSKELVSKFNKLDDIDKVNVSDIYSAIGTAMNCYVNSSVLIHKYYSLRVTTGLLGVVDPSSIKNSRSEEFLANYIDQAEEEARQLVAVLKDNNLGYVVPAFNYWQARSMSRQDIGEKLESIQGFWTAILEAKMTLMISGVTPQVKS